MHREQRGQEKQLYEHIESDIVLIDNQLKQRIELCDARRHSLFERSHFRNAMSNSIENMHCSSCTPTFRGSNLAKKIRLIHRANLIEPKRNNISRTKFKFINTYSSTILLLVTFVLYYVPKHYETTGAQAYDSATTSGSASSSASSSDTSAQASTNAGSCFGGLQTFEKISMSTFESPSSSSNAGNSFGSGILIQQDDQALTSECVNLCRSQSNCLSFVIDYNKFECKSYATTQQELQQEFDDKYQAARSINNSSSNSTEPGGYQASASTSHFQHLLPSASSNYFEKICLDGIANRNQFSEVCGQGRLWTIERVVDSFLDGYIEKEVTNVNNKDECSKLCIFETQFVCRSADYDQQSRLCRLSKEDRRTQPQAMRYSAGSNRQYLENQCATPGPSSCIYEQKKNVGIISMDALKFAQTVQECQLKCNQESTFNCRSYSFHQQRCFLSGDDSSSLNSNLIKLPHKQDWHYGEKKCLVELCTKGIFSYEKITGYTLRSSLATPIDLMMAGGSSLSLSMVDNNLSDLEKLQHEMSQTRLRHLLPIYHNPRSSNHSSNIANTMMLMMMANSNLSRADDPLNESESRHQRSASNLAITNHCRHSCDLGYLNCPAFTIDYKNNRCQRLDRNSQGRHHELVARDGFAYYEKICLRVPEIMSMCQDKYWIFERVIGYELAPRLYEKVLKFVQSRRDCEEYCLEEKQFQCRSALYNDDISECKLSRYDRRLALQEGAYHRNFNARISYLENQCIRDHKTHSNQQCFYEQARNEPAYPTFTEHIEMVQGANSESSLEMEQNRQHGSNSSLPARVGHSYCENLCNDNSKFECHSFGYYASTAQCFISGDDTVSAGESASTPSTGFVYYEKKCRLMTASSSNYSSGEREHSDGSTSRPEDPNLNPYFNPAQNGNHIAVNITPTINLGHTSTSRPFIANNNISIHIDQQLNTRPIKDKPEVSNETAFEPDQYKCGVGHTFVYQRISGFEPIGGYLTLLVKNDEQPGIVNDCAELCKKAYECRAFVIDYNNNQCFAMLENSSVGMLRLRQVIGKDYFEGFCVADHILMSGASCRNRTWVMDKIVDQAIIGVQHQKLIPDTDRLQCRQACLEERLFWCKSAMYDGSTGDCKLYSIDRESMPQMRLLFTKGVDFYENQCQIVSSSCPYDAIERDMTIVTTTKSVLGRSTFDCEHACNTEVTFNCRSYTYLDQYPSLPNFCLLSSDSRSTSQKGSVGERQRALYAERNCYYRRPRYPSGANQRPESMHNQPQPSPPINLGDPYQGPVSTQMHKINDQNTPKLVEGENSAPSLSDNSPPLGQGCEPHQYTFERTFGYDFRLAQKERAPISPTIGIGIACQQECLRRGDRCQSFVVEYTLPFQSCFLIDTQVGSNKNMLVKSPNSAYFEKMCLPRIGINIESMTHAQIQADSPIDMQSMDIAPSYSSDPWSPQVPNQLPYYLQQQQLIQNYPGRTCAKLWSFERFINHNFTASSDKVVDNILSRAHCEALCLNEANFNCRSATYDYTNRICRLFKNTRRTIMSHFVDLDPSPAMASPVTSISNNMIYSSTGSAQIINGLPDALQPAHSSPNIISESIHRQSSARQLSPKSHDEVMVTRDIDYLENTCVPEPSSCQYRQLYDLFSVYVDKINHAVSLSDCQRQCDLERLFSCKSINYDPSTKNCMLINEDLISLNRGQQASLIPRKNNIYSEKGNCEMISIQCNSQEMLVSINFDSPFRGRVMAKGNPEQCFLVGDGQTSIQFPIVFGPKCNSRQEGHNTFVNEVVIQQHPVIMTDSDKTVRVMCAFEAPDQTITLKNPSARDNKTGIDVGTPETSRTRHDKQHFNSVVSNKALPPSVLLRILDQNGKDAAMINLGDDLMLRIQMQMDGQNSALGIFGRNLVAKSSNGETLLLIDNDGCPVDPLVMPALEIDPKDGKSLISTFKAFRFPSSGLVNFEVQIRFCPERCQPVDCQKGQKAKSYGRRKRELNPQDNSYTGRTPILQSITHDNRNPIEALSTVMKPGKAFQYVRELMLTPKINEVSKVEIRSTSNVEHIQDENTGLESDENQPSSQTEPTGNQQEDQFDYGYQNQKTPSSQQSLDSAKQDGSEMSIVGGGSDKLDGSSNANNAISSTQASTQSPFQKSILMHVDEKVLPSTSYGHSRGLSQPHSTAPYGRFPVLDIESQHKRVTIQPPSTPSFNIDQTFPPVREETEPAITETSASSFFQESTEGQEDRLTTSSPMIQSFVTESNFNARESTEKTVEQVPKKEFNSPELNVDARDVPLRFSILVGENQPPTNGWLPGGPPPVLVMNSSKVDLDHIVIPGRGGQLDTASTSESGSQLTTNSISTSNITESTSAGNVGVKTNPFSNLENARGNALYDQTFDALSSNSIAAEVKVSHPTQSRKTPGLPSSSAASHDCHVVSGNSKLWTIIWTGTVVIALNICLVIISLVLYFKKVHFSKNHDIMRATSECGTHSSTARRRWPSVLLKSKNNLGTSLNTHEHFFCKLNSKPSGSVGGSGNEFNWPNLSSSSSHSTISSMASPLPVTSIRINQSHLSKIPFDSQATPRNNRISGHKNIFDINTYETSGNIHASYTDNIDETHPGTFQNLRQL